MKSAIRMIPVVLLVMACSSTGVNKGDFNIMSLQEEWQLGAQLSADISKQMTIVNDPAAQAYINDIGQRLVQQTEMASMPWQFHIVRDPAINAFSIPGGHVYVNTGLIAAAENASELAGVLAHEINHGVARHSTEQLSKAYGLEVLASVALGQNPAVYQQILASIIGNGALAKFSRAAEDEADKLGVRTMYGAGYNPRGMVTMFEELLSREQRQPSSVEHFFSTHPLTTDRISRVNAEIAKLPAKSGLSTDDQGFHALQSRVGA